MSLKTILVKVYFGFSDVVDIIDKHIKIQLDLMDLKDHEKKEIIFSEKNGNRNVYIIESGNSSIYKKIKKHETNVRIAYRSSKVEFEKICNENHLIRQEIQALIHETIGKSWKLIGFEVNEQFVRVKIKRSW